MTDLVPPSRPRLGQMTDDDLDKLHDEMQQLRDENAELHRCHAEDRDALAEMRATIEQYRTRLAETEKTGRVHAALHTSAADDLKTAEARVAELEAALARVRATVNDLRDEPHPTHDHVCPNDVRRYVLDAIAGPARSGPQS